MGTLPHLLSLGVLPGDLALGTPSGLAAAVLLVTIPRGSRFSCNCRCGHAIDASRGALLLLAYVVYFLFFVGLGLIISARSRTAQGALITLVGVWLVFAFLAPLGAFALAQQLYPVRTIEEFAAAIERIDQAGNVGFLSRERRSSAACLATHAVEQPNDLPVRTWDDALRA
jgi:hypothetical protein